MKLQALMLLACQALAQTSQIAGVVSDPLGANVTAAEVMLTQQETGVRRNTLTNSRGIYAVGGLHPGTYRIQVRKPGFQTLVRQDVVLEVSQNRRVDFELPIGDVREIVTVFGEPSVSESAEGGVGILAPRKLIENLPLNGRGLQTLLDIAPGTLTVPVRGAEIGQLSVNGQRPSSNYVMVDGVSANFGTDFAGAAGAMPNLSVIGSMHTVIALEDLQEFRLLTSSSGAEFGRASGGQIVLQSRSGGNSWQASAFVAARNQTLDANDWFLNSQALARPPLRWLEGGGTLGGPIRRNRRFVFLSLDAFGLRRSRSVQEVTLGVSARQNAPAAVKDLVGLYRLPDYGETFFVGAEQRQATLQSTSARWDDSLRPGLDAFVRYQRSPSRLLVNSAVFPSEDAQLFSLSQIAGGLNITLSPVVQQETRLQFGSARNAATSSISAPVAQPLASYLPSVGWPSIAFTSISVGTLTPLQEGRKSPTTQSQWNLTDAISILRGNHQWRLGVDWRRLRKGQDSRAYTVAASFNDLQSLAIKQPFLLAINRQEPYGARLNQASAYVQDAWKVSSALSISAGLRWEWYGAPKTVQGSEPFVLDKGLLRIAPLGTPMWRAPMADFAPRLGFALRLDPAGLWTVRGAAGLYFDSGSSGLFTALASQSGSTSAVYFNFGGSFDASQLKLPAASTQPPFAYFSAFTPMFRPPRVWEQNISLEHALPWRGVLSASFVASHGKNLVRREAGLVNGPDFAQLDLFTNAGRSDYKALQILLRQRAFHGLEALVSYSWSHALDNASRDTEVMLVASRSLDWGSSAFDVRHALTISFSYDPRWLRGWGIDGIARARTGLPVEMTAGLGAGGIESAYRPDYIGGQPIWISNPHAPGGKVLNPQAFAPPVGVQGSLGRNVIPGFGLVEMDLGVRREFKIRDLLRFQIRVEAFNLANHPNFGNPAGAASLPGFGQAPGLLNTYFGSSGLFGLPNIGTNSGLTRDLQIGGPRVLQVQLRFRF